MGRTESYHQRLLEEGYGILGISNPREHPIECLANMIGKLAETTRQLSDDPMKVVPADMAFNHEPWTIKEAESRHVLYVRTQGNYIFPREGKMLVIDRVTGETCLQPTRLYNNC